MLGFVLFCLLCGAVAAILTVLVWDQRRRQQTDNSESSPQTASFSTPTIEVRMQPVGPRRRQLNKDIADGALTGAGIIRGLEVTDEDGGATIVVRGTPGVERLVERASLQHAFGQGGPKVKVVVDPSMPSRRYPVPPQGDWDGDDDFWGSR